MDSLSVAASVIGIATAGIQVSIKVVTLASQVSTAADRISSIGNDVSLTSAILHQLGDLMGQKSTDTRSGLTIFNKAGLETTKSSAEVCQKIFEEVERETAKASSVIRARKRPIGEKVKLTIAEKLKWPFLQPSLEVLRTDLREAKGTLMLMLQLANLALSKSVADLYKSASSSIPEQQDIVRSILTLKRQQRQHLLSSSDSDTSVFEDQKRRRSETIRVVKDGSTQYSISDSLAEPLGSSAPTPAPPVAQRASRVKRTDQAPEQPKDLNANAGEDESRDSHLEQLGDSSRAASGNFTPFEIDSSDQTPRKPLFGPRAASGKFTPFGIVSSDQTPRKSLFGPQAASGNFTPFGIDSSGETPRKSLFGSRTLFGNTNLFGIDSTGETPRKSPFGPQPSQEQKVVRLSLLTLDPVITMKCSKLQIEWYKGNSRIPEKEIRELLAKIQADGLASVFATLEALHVCERAIVASHMSDFGDHVTLLSLKRTEQDLQEGSIVIKAVPSFQLITEQAAQEARNNAVKLARPLFVRVHRRYIYPETLDEYDLPWRWDDRNQDYIIIERWIPEHEQDILFEHTRALRRQQIQGTNVELRKDRDQLLLVRKKSPKKEAPSHKRERPFSFGIEDQVSSGGRFGSAGGAFGSGGGAFGSGGGDQVSTSGLFGSNGENQVSTEDEVEDGEDDDDSSETFHENVSEDNAYVNKLLGQYTTLFDTARHAEEGDR